MARPGLRMFIVRHGETDWTRARRFTGWQDVPLSEAGRRQCEAAARALAAVPLGAVYASPLQRARASAERIAEPYGLEVRIAPAFREIGLGQWEGLAHDEVPVRFPALWAVWRTAPERFVAPGGEPVATVALRVAAGIAALRASHHGDTIALVAHGVVIRLVVLHALGLGLEQLWSVDASPAGITEVEYRDEGATVHVTNGRAHLAPTTAA